MDHMDDIHFDLQCIVERAQRRLFRLQLKRLVNSDHPLSFFEYMVPEVENNLTVYNNMINSSCKQKCTLKDFQGYFKVLRQLSQYKN